ncbi:hypothetical protein DB29_02670 [Shouchella clausii]|nr:hypothetical protein DB29_02670 [Shouchella clausii]
MKILHELTNSSVKHGYAFLPKKSGHKPIFEALTKIVFPS